MPEYTGVWSAAEAGEFLDRTAVPLRLACHTPTGRLWVLSLWYRYQDGVFHCATSSQAAVVRYLVEDPEVAFEVSTNQPPYAGVRGNGTARIETDPDKAVLRGLIDRYLGDTESPLADRLLADDRDEVTIHITPARLYSWDFTRRMQAGATGAT